MLDLLPFPIAVVAHDSGAANHIIAWSKNIDRKKMRVCLAGPALQLWKSSFPYASISTLADSLSIAKSLLSGTGWASNLEHEARKRARKLGIKSVAVVDHWTNYRNRFIRNGEEILPDEIWVVDNHAQKLAETEFPYTNIVQLPNLYLDGLVKEIRSIEAKLTRATESHVLYVLEPIRQVWDSDNQPGELQALDFFVKQIGLLRLGDNPSIKLRLHPSDTKGKYDKWLEAHKALKISLDDSLNLAESIAWSDMVVGCQTYAMVVSLAAGKRVISSIPPWAPPCILPQPEIVKLTDLLPLTFPTGKVTNSKN
jgi:hypothetical protein